jgi:uncharacterized protein
VRIAAVGDLHVREPVGETFRDLFSGLHDHADALVLCGDLTDRGHPAEAERLAEWLRECRVPIVAVLGNHDFESGREDELRRVLGQAGVKMIDNEPVVLQDVGFVGVKGFAGGFDTLALQPWGEAIVKHFVQESVDEALRLERALARLHGEHAAGRTVVVLHYAPVHATVDGEPAEIIPFLGSSRLADPIDRFGATLVVHAHAHHGSPSGKTAKGTPVYNVSLPVLRREQSDTPYRLLEV